MPRIADHNRAWKGEGHAPSELWPDDCYVQWGGSGIVIGTTDSYRTAFFEAFPEEGGFFRGEGPDIRAAEADCLEKYRRFRACDHLWGRKGYMNGGAVCRRCGAFQVRFKPIPRLGAFRDPIRPEELSLALDGACRGEDRTPSRERYARRLRLRLIRAGIRVPDDRLEAESYKAALKNEILDWFRRNKDSLSVGSNSALSRVFEQMALCRLDDEAR